MDSPNEDSLALLKELTEAHAVPGFEDEVREIFEKKLQNEGTLGRDRLGSTYCQLQKVEDEKAPRVLVAGHMDEVGFRVQSINKQGYISFVPVGGWWGHTLLSQRVQVKTRSGRKVLGVITSKPPHFLSESERKNVLPLDAMFIDLGAVDAEQVAEWGIQVGDPVAPLSSFEPSAHPQRFFAKAFDNRVGMGGAIEIGKSDFSDLNANLFTAGTVQEEVGLRGSRTLGNLLKPHFAIVLEGPPADDTPGLPLDTAQGQLGKGVQIRLHDPSAIMNQQLVDLALKVAQEKKIPHQVTVRASGGTDAGGFQFSGEGVACIVLGVPARYIHSHTGLIDFRDYQAMLDLTEALVRAIAE